MHSEAFVIFHFAKLKKVGFLTIFKSWKNSVHSMTIDYFLNEKEASWEIMY